MTDERSQQNGIKESLRKLLAELDKEGPIDWDNVEHMLCGILIGVVKNRHAGFSKKIQEGVSSVGEGVKSFTSGVCQSLEDGFNRLAGRGKDTLSSVLLEMVGDDIELQKIVLGEGFISSMRLRLREEEGMSDEQVDKILKIMFEIVFTAKK